MDDKQLALLLTAMSDQTAAMNRMADAMAGILLHLDPKQAAKFAAPGYQRPLAAYATFDWNSIDATVIGFDRHGATEVEHNGVAYRRYRSNDDDPKGIDIRFRRVVAGTPEGKDMVWATLIKFADKRQKDPPRPLRGELAEKIEHAASEQATRANAPAPLPAAQKPPESLPSPDHVSRNTDSGRAWSSAGIPPATQSLAMPTASEPETITNTAPWANSPLVNVAAKQLVDLNRDDKTMTIAASRLANDRAAALATSCKLPQPFIDEHHCPKDEVKGSVMREHARTVLTAIVTGQVTLPPPF